MTPEDLDVLRTASKSLPAFAKLIDQKTGKVINYDPNRLSAHLQSDVLAYYDNTPRDNLGRTLWMLLLGYRQGGKSLVAELAAYARTAYTPGMVHVCIADKKDRADELHTRVQYCHRSWPEELQSPTTSSLARRQITFEHGGKMSTLSAQEESAGIGMAIDSLHASEVAFWPDAGGTMTKILPAMMGRDNSLILAECTPATLDEPSADWWKDEYTNAKYGMGRWFSKFYPFWDSHQTREPWVHGDALELEEIRLLERYFHQGLTKDNLAFRRRVLNTDSALRRNPELFGVWYPFDDVSCWVGGSSGTIPTHILDRIGRQIMVPWKGPFMTYKNPHPDAQYVIGVDPAGWGGRDHAAFHVLEVWDDCIEQVAVFSSNMMNPVNFCANLLKVGELYNKALIVIENNGVGLSSITPMLMSGYTNIYHESVGKPGKNSNSKTKAEMTAWMLDALLDKMIIHDQQTYEQLTSYKNDKLIEMTETSEMLSDGVAGRGKRRERHHWDKVSALMLAMVGVRACPSRVKAPNLARIWEKVPWHLQPEHVRLALQAQKPKPIVPSGRRVRWVPRGRRG